MATIYYLLKMLCVLTASFLIGNWFLSELKKAKKMRLPWYKPYLTIPGMLIIFALLLPFLFKYVIK